MVQKLISTLMKQEGGAPKIDGNLRIVRLMCPFHQGAERRRGYPILTSESDLIYELRFKNSDVYEVS